MKTEQNNTKKHPSEGKCLLNCLVLLAECPTEGPEACHQLCTVSYHTYTCSCMPGFKLHIDERSCLPEGFSFLIYFFKIVLVFLNMLVKPTFLPISAVDFPCGRLSTTTPLCPHGNCPWQVSCKISANGNNIVNFWLLCN